MIFKVVRGLIIFFFLSLCILFYWIAWKFYSGEFSIVDRTQVSQSLSQFIALNGKDEYVIAELNTTETESRQEYKKVFGYPIGDTTVSISVNATYQYHVKLREISHKIDQGIVILSIPNIYLSTPVNIDISSMLEESERFGFGDSQQNLIQQMRKDLSHTLEKKGRIYKATVYDQAAKALADNFNQYFLNNGDGALYSSIVVNFTEEQSPSLRRFEYNNPLCNPEPCLFKWNIDQNKIFKAE